MTPPTPENSGGPARRRPVPPSFSPTNAATGRPQSADGAVPVGSANSANARPAAPASRDVTRPAAQAPGRGNARDAVAMPARRPVRVTSAEHGAAHPRPVPPQEPYSGNGPRGARPVPVPPTPRSVGSTGARPAPAPAGRGRARPAIALPTSGTDTYHGAPALSGGPGGPHGPSGPRAGGPGGPGGPGSGPTPKRKSRRKVIAFSVIGLVLVLLLAWPIGLMMWANGKITHIDALSGASATPGTTYLLAGSDSRDDGAITDGVEGSRTDTIMVLHVPASGPAALISLPRDTYVDIPGHKANKLNAAYSRGGSPLLVATVETLTGLTMDHYVEIGLGGIEEIVNTVGGVNLCLDYKVKDKKSGLKWKKPGCEDVNGKKALAFVRMRYADPKGDIGRADRQRQLITKLTGKVATPSTLFKPGEQVGLIGGGLGALAVDEGTNIMDLGRLALAFRSATGEGGITGTPPIKSLNYRPGGVGSAVQLDPDTTPAFFKDMAAGKLPPGTVGDK